jgi:hypothetical protein
MANNGPNWDGLLKWSLSHSDGASSSSRIRSFDIFSGIQLKSLYPFSLPDVTLYPSHSCIKLVVIFDQPIRLLLVANNRFLFYWNIFLILRDNKPFGR